MLDNAPVYVVPCTPTVRRNMDELYAEWENLIEQRAAFDHASFKRSQRELVVALSVGLAALPGLFGLLLALAH
ncbi:hypothetical protein [Chromobacterium haemolyticum]|uniref:hypothetical protein n=1 Tax=Chromobacterium haemolyticum TaxID=394935 RepID=UPI00244700FD|nr:hypothetical protein [Chromobacterium haemolyticum]MDH0342064.1 hypothetical protein [Chromobacterium haemolyticum]